MDLTVQKSMEAALPWSRPGGTTTVVSDKKEKKFFLIL